MENLIVNFFNYLRVKKALAIKTIYKFNHVFFNVHQDFTGFDKYAAKGAYHWIEIDANPFYKNKAENISSQCLSAGSIVDFGCGDGAILGYLARDFNQIEFIGIEADRRACVLARKALKDRNIHNVRIINSAFSSFNSIENKADIAYSMDVIEHLPDPGIMLQRMHSVLRVGGKAIIGTPLFINRDLVSPYHVHEFNIDELTTLVQGYFCDVQVVLLPERRLDGIVYQNNFCIISGIKADS